MLYYTIEKIHVGKKYGDIWNDIQRRLNMVKIYRYINTLQEEFDLTDRKVIIWGKSISALNLYVELKSKNVNVIGFTDSFTKQLQLFANLPLYPFEQVLKMRDIIIYIATLVPQYQIEILEHLERESIPVLCKGEVYGPGYYDISKMKKKIKEDKDKISQVRSILKDEKSRKTFDYLIKYRISNDYQLLSEIYESGHSQYFPGQDIFKVSEDEIFIDAGAYNGATSVDFSEWVHKKYKKIYLMEPDDLMKNIAKEYIELKHLKNYEIIGKGAYSKSTILNFKNIAMSGSSYVDETGESKIETISIDEMLQSNPATYIKMDVEGVELPALMGAEQTIKHHKPKLAISIYHKDDDLWNIPYYIYQKYPWYQLFIRHYTKITTETILYAVV
jgi:FkbM family methyltransferase